MIAKSFEVLFKQTSGGYVFREPLQIRSANARHYLVNEQQKAELIATLAGRHPVLARIGLAAGVGVAVFAASLAVFALSPHPEPQISDTIAMVLVSSALILAIFFAWRAWKLKQIAPQLSKLTPTDQKITRAEMREGYMAAMPTGLLWFCEVVFASLAASHSYSLVTGLSSGRLLSAMVPQIVQIVAFGGLAIYYAFEIAKRRKKPHGETGPVKAG